MMRYAVYFCPSEGSVLADFGRDWLAIEAVPGIAPIRLRALLADVRRYGWHATVCAPAALANGIGYATLRQTLIELATHIDAFELPLRLDRLAGFLALRPTAGEAAIGELAERCLRGLHALRAAPTQQAMQRRASGLDEVELALLQQYGYPYVLERYRFHMTLAASAHAAEEAALHKWLMSRLGSELSADIDALTICCEAEPGRDFEVVERIPLRVGATA